jgi:hypothetical protein
MNDSVKGKVKMNSKGDLADFASDKSWTLRVFSRMIQDLCDDEQLLGRVLGQALAFQQ